MMYHHYSYNKCTDNEFANCVFIYVRVPLNELMCDHFCEGTS